MPDAAALCEVASRIARDAGRLLVQRLYDVRTGVEAKSTPTDLVSEVDKASEALIVTALREQRPDDAILAEEGSNDAGTSGLRWVVDPLDGTINYLYRREGFTVSIAVEDAEGTLAGIVYDPQRDEEFAATRGGGAYLDGARLRCSPQTDLAHALVATGFAYSAATRAEQAALLPRVLPSVRDIRRLGAATLDLCAVACGRADAYYERGLAPWDLAAGGLIAREAGATVTTLGDLVVAAPPALYGPLRALLDAAAPDQQRGPA